MDGLRNGWLMWAFSLALGMGFTVGLVGNVATVVVIQSVPSLQSTTNRFLANLALADLLLLIIGTSFLPPLPLLFPLTLRSKESQRTCGTSGIPTASSADPAHSSASQSSVKLLFQLTSVVSESELAGFRSGLRHQRRHPHDCCHEVGPVSILTRSSGDLGLCPAVSGMWPSATRSNTTSSASLGPWFLKPSKWMG